MKSNLILLIFLLITYVGTSQTIITASQKDTTIVKLSQKGNSVILKLSNGPESTFHWNLETTKPHLLKLKKQEQKNKANQSEFEFKELGIPGKTHLALNKVNDKDEIINTIHYRLDLKVSPKTKVYKILKEYGDIADVMEAFGLKRVGSFGLRKFITRFISVKTAAKVHKIKLDKQLEMVQDAIDKKQIN